jgi:hypothetical protein
MAYITRHDRSQRPLLPEAVGDYVGSDTPVRFIDAFAASVCGAETGRVAQAVCFATSCVIIIETNVDPWPL